MLLATTAPSQQDSATNTATTSKPPPPAASPIAEESSQKSPRGSVDTRTGKDVEGTVASATLKATAAPTLVDTGSQKSDWSFRIPSSEVNVSSSGRLVKRRSFFDEIPEQPQLQKSTSPAAAAAKRQVGNTSPAAANAASQDFLSKDIVGRRVAKYFNGSALYLGTVVSCPQTSTTAANNKNNSSNENDSSNNSEMNEKGEQQQQLLWHIRYDDNDEEQYEAEELQRALDLYETKGANWDPLDPLRKKRKRDKKHEEISDPKINVGAWTKEEHDRFLEGLQQYGNQWDAVAAFVGTRRKQQIISRVQRLFGHCSKFSFSPPDFAKKRQQRSPTEGTARNGSTAMSQEKPISPAKVQPSSNINASSSSSAPTSKSTRSSTGNSSSSGSLMGVIPPDFDFHDGVSNDDPADTNQDGKIAETLLQNLDAILRQESTRARLDELCLLQEGYDKVTDKWGRKIPESVRRINAGRYEIFVEAIEDPSKDTLAFDEIIARLTKEIYKSGAFGLLFPKAVELPDDNAIVASLTDGDKALKMTNDGIVNVSDSDVGNCSDSTFDENAATLELVMVGSRVSIFWPGENHYFDGTVTCIRSKNSLFSPIDGKREGELGTHFIEYDDGDYEWLDLHKHTFKLLSKTRHKQGDNKKKMSSVCGKQGTKRKNTGSWTAEEISLFHEGMKLYGKQWKTVASFIGTRSTSQVISKAQRHFGYISIALSSSSQPIGNRSSGNPLKAILLHYYRRQIAKDPRYVGADEIDSKDSSVASSSTFQITNYSILASYGNVPAQFRHIDLTDPEHAQFGLLISDQVPGTLYYRPATNCRERQQLPLDSSSSKYLHEDQDHKSNQKNGEDCASTAMEVHTVHDLKHHTQKWVDMPDDVAQVLQQNQVVVDHLNSFGPVLSDNLQECVPKLPVVADNEDGTNTTASSLLPAGTVLTLPGGVVHAGPACQGFRAVLFASGSHKRHGDANAADTADMDASAPPTMTVEPTTITYHPDTQYCDAVLCSDMIDWAWDQLAVPQRKYLLYHLADYLEAHRTDVLNYSKQQLAEEQEEKERNQGQEEKELKSAEVTTTDATPHYLYKHVLNSFMWEFCAHIELGTWERRSNDSDILPFTPNMYTDKLEKYQHETLDAFVEHFARVGGALTTSKKISTGRMKKKRKKYVPRQMPDNPPKLPEGTRGLGSGGLLQRVSATDLMAKINGEKLNVTVYAFPDPEDGVMLYFPIVNRWQGGTGTIKYTLIRHKKSIFMGYDTGKLLDHNGNEIECYRSQPPPFRIANAIIL